MSTRSIMVVITADGSTGRVIATPAKGAPRVIEGDAGKLLSEMANDPTLPEHKVEAAGIDVLATLRGIAKAFEEVGAKPGE